MYVFGRDGESERGRERKNRVYDKQKSKNHERRESEGENEREGNRRLSGSMWPHSFCVRLSVVSLGGRPSTSRDRGSVRGCLQGRGRGGAGPWVLVCAWEIKKSGRESTPRLPLSNLTSQPGSLRHSLSRRQTGPTRDAASPGCRGGLGSRWRLGKRNWCYINQRPSASLYNSPSPPPSHPSEDFVIHSALTTTCAEPRATVASPQLRESGPASAWTESWLDCFKAPRQNESHSPLIVKALQR